MSAQHTAGPWRWELNEEHKSLHLIGGKPRYDLTIIQPARWGMGSATLMIRDTAHDGMNIMHKLHERRDWIAPFRGRDHHAKWCADVTHPDMRLIAAAPELLRVMRLLVDNAQSCVFEDWLAGACPSGDADDVQRQFEASDEYGEFCADWQGPINAIAEATGERP